MTEAPRDELFPAPNLAEADRQPVPKTGLLPSQMLREAVALGREILSPQPIADDQIQPASIDLRLGEIAYRVRASFLPGSRASVRDKLDQLSMHRIDLTAGAVLPGLHLHRVLGDEDSAWARTQARRAPFASGVGCWGGSRPELSARSPWLATAVTNATGERSPEALIVSSVKYGERTLRLE